MSRVVLFVCLLMLVSAAVALDLPGVPKVPDLGKLPEAPKVPDLGLPGGKAFVDLDDDK